MEFHYLIIFVMEKLNELGMKYIKEIKKFWKYHSLMYFEQSRLYYEKYLKKVDKALFKKDFLDSLYFQEIIFTYYIQVLIQVQKY